MTTPFSDFQPAPNQGARPDLYELENQALDPDGVVLAAMRALAPWSGRTLVDLGCGSGYWLPGSAEHIPLGDASVDVVHARGYGDRPDVTDAWWAERGASRTEVMSRWQFGSRADLEAVLRLEFPGGVAGRWLADHPGVTGLSYGYVLFTIR